MTAGPGIWVPLAGEHLAPTQLIGERTCAACRAWLFDHCEIPGHLPPCCPGRCRGPNWLQRALGVLAPVHHQAGRQRCGHGWHADPPCLLPQPDKTNVAHPEHSCARPPAHDPPHMCWCGEKP